MAVLCFTLKVRVILLEKGKQLIGALKQVTLVERTPVGIVVSPVCCHEAGCLRILGIRRNWNRLCESGAHAELGGHNARWR